jgi:hypothetical protein
MPDSPTWGGFAPIQVGLTECALSDIAENAASFPYQQMSCSQAPSTSANSDTPTTCTSSDHLGHLDRFLRKGSGSSQTTEVVTRARFERATPSFGGCSENFATYRRCFAIRKTWFGPVVPPGARKCHEVTRHVGRTRESKPPPRRKTRSISDA